ncbi:MAG: hypothetical protein A3J83_08010 [Elusimicrobia bacterium RIFOXYA2_FULL_40_6]|nr:MAG: hypothetical protein A3J83_08010 [Elusimicrobia bacterium RIFOXYA2_FULL_40_6]
MKKITFLLVILSCLGLCCAQNFSNIGCELQNIRKITPKEPELFDSFWLPDGTHIVLVPGYSYVYGTNRKISFPLYIVNITDGKCRMIAKEVIDYTLKISEDNKKLAYEKLRNKMYVLTDKYYIVDIVSGKEVRDLKKESRTWRTFNDYGHGIKPMTIPKGYDEIVTSSNTFALARKGNNYAIINRLSNKLIELDNPFPESKNIVQSKKCVLNIAWSPNGENLLLLYALEWTTDAQPVLLKSDLFLININGGITRLTDKSDISIWNMHWSPNGKQISFVNRNPKDSKENQLYIGDLVFK